MGVDALKQMWGVDSQGSRRDGGTGDSSNPRATCATASVFQQPRSHSSRHLSTTPPVPSNRFRVLFYPAPSQEYLHLPVQLHPPLSTPTLTTLAPWLGLPDQPESFLWRRRDVENPSGQLVREYTVHDFPRRR
jgi:hypothetical protein